MIAEKHLFFIKKINESKEIIQPKTLLKNNVLEQLLKSPDLYKTNSNYKILENKILNKIKNSYGFCASVPKEQKDYNSGLLYLFNFEINRLNAWDKNILTDTIVQTAGGLVIFDQSNYDFIIKVESKKLEEVEVYSSTKFSLNNVNIIAVDRSTQCEDIIIQGLSLSEVYNMIVNMSSKKKSMNNSIHKDKFKSERSISDVSAGV